MLLTGRSPWYVSSEKTLLAIKAGRPNYEAKHFDQLTDDGKDFVRALLSYDCKLRPSARDALQHRWLASRSDAPLGPCLRSLRGFASLSGMQRWSRVLAIWFHDVEGDLQLQFQRLCNDRCGIQKATFVEALEAEGWIDDALKLFDAVNLSGSGEISYSEFLAATWRETMLDETSLKLVFQRFDADGDGLITEADLHEALGAKIEAGKLLNDIDARDAGGAHVRNFVSSLRCVPTKPLPTLLGDNPIVVLKRQESSDPSLCERVADLDAHPDASQVMDGIIA
jgi:Ca2+-binding EF-hand superfamily protein